MELQKVSAKPYAILPSGVLIVEPHPGLLAARAMLISAAEYFVASSDDGVPGAALQETDVRVAILSQSLGTRLLAALAQEVRLCWPSARILIFGKAALDLEDHLYDDSIDQHCRPEQLLDTLFHLTRNEYPRRAVGQSRLNARQLSLSGLGWASLRLVPAESDPSKKLDATSMVSPRGRDVPTDERPLRFA